MFDLKSASIEIRKIAQLSGIKSGKWEQVNAGTSPDHFVATDAGGTVVARVSNKNKSIEITANDIVYAHLLR